MNNALEIFSRIPKTHNCAQSVAAGCGLDSKVPDYAAMGGGRAPGGLCGALFAAMEAVPESKREALRKEFVSAIGSSLCREIKQKYGVPCSRCVETAAALLEKYR